MRFVFISEGDLFLKEDGKDAVELESHFAREALERTTARNNRHAWKGQGRDDASMYSAGVVWGRQSGGRPENDHPVVRAVSRGAAENELLYTLAMSASSGLFRYNLANKEEYRLFHRQDFDGCGLCCHAPTGEIVLSSRNADHLGKLEFYHEAERRRNQLTDGDGHDSNPCQDPSSPHVIYFQSSGVARNEEGDIVALGPVAIHRLDRTTREMTVLLEDEHWDYLQPKIDAQGTLYYIRRPYAIRDDLPLGQKLKGFFLLPFHLASAVFGFLDAFSRMFGKQSLRPAGGNKPLALSRSRFATFHDTTIALEKVLKHGDQLDDSMQLVPATWELIRRDSAGNETVVAKHVVSYDLGPNGEVLYSDGLRVWQAGAVPRKLVQGRIIQSVVIA
ncbi:MAG TPA: hypothetical protein VIM71_16060 [Lacunisphaera sp.]